MGQQLSAFLSTPQEIIKKICGDKESEMTFALTCKALYVRYENCYREEIMQVLCNSPDWSFFYDQCGEALQDYMKRTNWLHLKYEPISNYKNSSHPAKVLCFNATKLIIPKEFNCACPDTLIIFNAPDEPTPSNFEKIGLAITNFFGKKAETMPIASFVEKFTNLTSISLLDLTLDDEIVSVISKLRLLRHISLYHCKMEYSHLLKMFKDCPSLEGIQLIYPDFDHVKIIKFSSGLKIIKISYRGSFEVDMSDCTGLEDLAIKSLFHIPVNVILPKSECLHKLELDGHFGRNCFDDNSLVTVETLILNWPYIFNEGEIKELFVDYVGYRKRNLNLSTLKNLKEIRIKDYNILDEVLRCTLPSGLGTVHVKLIPPSKSEPIKSQEFQLDPTRPIDVLLHHN